MVWRSFRVEGWRRRAGGVEISEFFHHLDDGLVVFFVHFVLLGAAHFVGAVFAVVFESFAGADDGVVAGGVIARDAG